MLTNGRQKYKRTFHPSIQTHIYIPEITPYLLICTTQILSFC